MIYKQNLHTHSIYDDGNDEMEAMLLEAIKQGYTHFGFSGHGYNHPADPWSMSEKKEEAYFRDIKTLKEKYANQIKLYAGMEQDSIGKVYSKEMGLDYIIGSVHFVTKNGVDYPIDYSKQMWQVILQDVYQNDFLAFAKDYYQAVAKLAQYQEVDIIGHIDLIAKYNEDACCFDFENPAYLKEAYIAIDTLIAAGKIFEINTGAMARGSRKEPYPHESLLAYIQKQGGKILINADCHNKDKLAAGYEAALAAVKKAGFSFLMLLDQDGFINMPIEEFE
jgi:histidinol-phosphatase (PHP family)